MGKKKYLRQIHSYKELIAEHLGKIENEKLKINPDFKLISYWEKEIEKFKYEIIKSEKRLKRR